MVLFVAENLYDVGPLMVVEVSSDHSGVLAVGVNDLEGDTQRVTAAVHAPLVDEAQTDEELLKVEAERGGRVSGRG